VRIVGKGDLRIQGREWRGRYEGIDWDVKKMDMRGEIYESKYKDMELRQEGMGKMELRAEGVMKVVSSLEGNMGESLEILSEENTHERSLVIRSRKGGILIEGQRVNIGGMLGIGNVNVENMGDMLKVGGMMEVDGLRVGENMCIGKRGISLRQREEVEMRNMDLNLDGLMRVKKLNVGKIDGGKVLEIDGNVRVNNGLNVRGDGGLVMSGVELGRWERGNRVGIRVNIGESIWSEGIRVEGRGRGLVMDGDGEIGGEMRVGRLVVREDRERRSRELEEDELEGMLREMEVEMGEDGTLVGGDGDVWGMMKKMMAVIRWQERRLKNLI